MIMLLMLCKRILPFFMAICLLCSISFCVNGQNIILSPSSIMVELTGGDVITVNVTARQDSSSDLICNIGYSILPDDIGINISFSEDVFLLNSGENVVIVVTINVSHIIIPGIYSIDIYANGEKKEIDKKGDGFSGWPPSDNSNDNEDDVIPDDKDELPDDTLLLDDNPPGYDQPSFLSRYYMPIFLIAILITVLFMLLIIYKIRREKENEN